MSRVIGAAEAGGLPRVLGNVGPEIWINVVVVYIENFPPISIHPAQVSCILDSH